MSKIDQTLVEKVFKNCTWGNTTETPEDWLKILESSDEKAKQRIFNIIFREDPDGSSIRSLFDRDRISIFTSALNRPMNRPHLEKRRKVWRFLYCGEKSSIPELDWMVAKNGK